MRFDRLLLVAFERAENVEIEIFFARWMAVCHFFVVIARLSFAVVIFVLIDFLLIIVPFVFLELRPEATKALLKHSQDWLLSHALQLMAAIALLLGAYLAISGLVRLS